MSFSRGAFFLAVLRFCVSAPSASAQTKLLRFPDVHSQMLIERLSRELLATGFSRNNDLATTYPAVVFTGHLVALLDENSASDGDISPAMFREAHLGPLIAKRSWAGSSASPTVAHSSTAAP